MLIKLPKLEQGHSGGGDRIRGQATGKPPLAWGPLRNVFPSEILGALGKSRVLEADRDSARSPSALERAPEWVWHLPPR